GIAGQSRHMGDELAASAALQRGRDGDLDAELVGTVRLAFADALHFGCMQAVDIGSALALALLVHPAGQPQRLGEDVFQADIAGDLAADVAAHPSEIGTQRFQCPVGAFDLTPCLRASVTRRSRARCSSFASVGKVIALGCTVVSTMTRVKSAGLAAPLRVARCRLSCNSAISFSSPMRWRQRVIEERSNGSLWQKNSAPQSSW